MASFFLWYLLITLLGWLTFPLAYRLFPALADRGYALARAFGLLLWGFLFWILATLGVLQNDLPGLLLALLVLAAVSGSGLARRENWQDWTAWLRANRRMLVTVEVLFLVAFAFLAFVRAGNPEIAGTEKPMELAFINAILRSPTFPPHDPWLSGYGISYYYFGYVMTAMLAKFTGTLGSVAFNLMLALIFALSASGAYGLVYNLLARRGIKLTSGSLTRLPLLGPLFLLLVSNFEALLEVMYARHWFWKIHPDGTMTSGFWKWLDLADLSTPPSLPVSWTPQRYYWWWRASRVITDHYPLNGNREIIDEFPFFSYLLGDLHPHVLAMPFGLLAVAAALNLFLGGWEGETNLGFYRLKLRPAGLIFGGLLLGGLAFLNVWDILVGFALLVGAYVLTRAGESGWSWRRLQDLFALGAPLGGLAILFYLPFYIGFSSQAGGILPNLENPTKGIQLWIMFGPLFLPIFVYLIFLWRQERRPANWIRGFLLAGGLALLLWAFSWLLGLLAQQRMPEFVHDFIGQEGFLTAQAFFIANTGRRLYAFGGWMTILVLIGAALAFLIQSSRGHEEMQAGKTRGMVRPASTTFVLFLVLVAGLAILAPEYVYLRDGFGNRMNTIFKFYYEAWLLFSLAAAFCACILLQKLRGRWAQLFMAGLSIVLFLALLYPALGLLTKTNGFQLPAFREAYRQARASGDPHPLRTAASVWTLDGGALFDKIYPDDMAAADWLRAAPYGTIVEAIIPGEGYNDYSHISEYSGLPTVLGWEGHEAQWRGGYDPQGTRHEDIQRLYQTRSWEEARAILQQYGIRYVFVGTLERQAYLLDELKFQQHLTTVFQSGNVTVYEVP